MKMLKIFAALLGVILFSAAFTARAGDATEVPARVACQNVDMFKEVMLAPQEERAPRAVAQLVTGSCIRFDQIYAVTVKIPPVETIEIDGHLVLFFEAIPADPTYDGPTWYVFFITPGSSS